MRAIAFIILLFFNLVGLSQNSLFDSKNLCFDGSYIENINIHTHGYYKVPIVINNDTIYRNCVFYKNGFFLNNFSINYFESTKNDKIGFYNRGSTQWGLYKVSGDTIKAVVRESPFGMSSLEYEYIFIIINTDSIIDKSNNLILEFIPYKYLPGFEKSWIIKKKWFWCDKNQYKEWKKVMKRKIKY